MVTRLRTVTRGLFRGDCSPGVFQASLVELMSDRLPNAIDRHVASRLRLRRLEAGLTQTMLADELGISFQQLQKYEGAVNRNICWRALSACADAQRAGAVLFRWSEQAPQEARIAI
jgi:Helix-turn-helix domain